MSKRLTETTLAAAKALEDALNSVPNGQAVDVATGLIMLSAGFLKAVAGDDFVKGFLEEALRDVDQSPIIMVYTGPKTQH